MVRFKPGFGIVDEQGRLAARHGPAAGDRDTSSIRRTPKTAVLSWPAVRDPGGLRNYRIKIGARTLFVPKPAVTITRATLRAARLGRRGRPGRQHRAGARRSRAAACADGFADAAARYASAA